MDGVATVVDVPGDSSGTKKRRRRRARREEARAALEQNLTGDHGSPNGNGSVAEAISPSPPADAAVVSVAVLPELESPVNQAILLEAPAPAPDEFKDLLGQAVGLRLDSVSREFGGVTRCR